MIRRRCRSTLMTIGVGTALAVMGDPLLTASGGQPARLGMTVVVDEVSQAMPRDKAQRTPAEQKLDSHIVAVIHASRDANSLPESLSRLPDAASLEIDRHGQVHVDIQATVTGGLVSAIGSLGGTIESTFANYGTIRAWIPLAAADHGRRGLARRRSRQRSGIRPVPSAERAPGNPGHPPGKAEPHAGPAKGSDRQRYVAPTFHRCDEYPMTHVGCLACC